MSIPKVSIIDFETEPIRNRPQYPPIPAGVGIQMPTEKKPRYYAWGHHPPAPHKANNNCTRGEAMEALEKARKNPGGVLYQHGKFDEDVAVVHCEQKALPWDKIHDTEFLLFLHDPHARSLSLKPAAEKLLGMPPEERDAVVEWLEKHCLDLREPDPRNPKKKIPFAAYIATAPGDVVAPYGCGDIIRTDKLFRLLYKEIEQRGMIPAYDRERRLMPILLENETEGVWVDLPLLRAEVKLYQAALEKSDEWLRKRLGIKDLNIDSDDDFGKALDSSGVVTNWTLTKTGKKSVAKANLTPDKYNDPKVASVYGYRNRLATCLRMFMVNWLEQAEATGGYIHTNWNQVRQDHGNENLAGTRSGRLSSNPNLQNLSKNFETKSDGFVHPKFLNVPPLPLIRKYLLPDEGHVWIHRDYSQQELRILAHYEDGELLAAYLADPKLDVHAIVQSGLVGEGINFVRDAVKRFVFQKIYGGGIPAICAALSCDALTAKRVISSMERSLPGYKALEKSIQRMGRAGEPIVTWGGREYYCEPPGFSKKHNRTMTFEYKLLNYLIQGSAADCTKEALIRYSEHPKRQSRLLVTVHDEINIGGPFKRVKEEMKILQECMQSVEFDLPMASDGKIGPNWGTLEKFVEA